MSEIAVVTGAGTGVGRAVVLKLAAAGWNVALIGRTQRTLDETISLHDGGSGKLVPFVCDVSDESAVNKTAANVRARLGDASLLVNSAGTNVPRRSLAELSSADYRQIIEANLNGSFYCVAAFLPAMRRAGFGTIVNIVSDAGLTANAFAGSAYIASKFGLTGLTQTINVEERKNGIRACAISPGEIDTPILEKRPAPVSLERRQKMLQPQDVAECVMLAVNLPKRAVVEQLVVRPTF
jgi:NAD(P)-dependent dehydrogenase (short-subunit alcohol dehydrogenase family)